MQTLNSLSDSPARGSGSGGGPRRRAEAARKRSGRNHEAPAFSVARPDGSELMRLTSRDSSQFGERAQ